MGSEKDEGTKAADDVGSAHDTMPAPPPSRGRGRQGFASMSAEAQREIASKGGIAAHARRTAHEFTSEEARAAGKKGGAAISADRAHMAAIGRMGGLAGGRKRRATGKESAS